MSVIPDNDPFDGVEPSPPAVEETCTFCNSDLDPTPMGDFCHECGITYIRGYEGDCDD
jgi:hypothetical protein